MDGALASLVGVVGTLLGACATFLFQRNAADRAEARARDRIAREERLTAYGGFAEAVVAYRRAQYDPHHRPGDEGALTEAYHCRLLAQQALLRVQFVTDDPHLVRLAERALDVTARVAGAADRTGLAERAEQAKRALGLFVSRAREHLDG
ncbi:MULTISPECIES: hypothetical protein [Streptomyces]|uniref:hypothetical protein n=1 Tax=Streptomyces TaxID=1883 RepID=UPI00143BED25|nr:MULTISPECIES: hypothetical protein [unclassified Streptomyces]MDT0423778.1 hypothetical protein [Streptomyces sp. DSM 41859]NJA55683.1 hypothetical protein [Streptomyces sp. NEAU-H3]